MTFTGLWKKKKKKTGPILINPTDKDEGKRRTSVARDTFAVIVIVINCSTNSGSSLR